MNTNNNNQTSPISDMPKHEYKLKLRERPLSSDCETPILPVKQNGIKYIDISSLFSDDDEIKSFNKLFFSTPDTPLNRELKKAIEKMKQSRKHIQSNT